MVPENVYCGYCSRLIGGGNTVDDNNTLICVSCEGQFHMECTSLAGSPKEQHHLKWKCNNCVKNEPQELVCAHTEPIDYNCGDLSEQIEHRLAVLRQHFANSKMQIVYARITSIEYERKDKDECLIIVGVPCPESENLIELVMKTGDPLGVRLTSQQVFRCIPDDAARPNCSLVIKFDSPATRKQLLLNSYLHTIMRPIILPQQRAASEWKLGADDEEAPSSTLLPQTTTVASSITTSPLYMYEFLSAQRQTMVVKSDTAEGQPKIPAGARNYLASDCVVVHDESNRVNIIPVIKISSAPMIRLASKESFDDFEGKLFH